MLAVLDGSVSYKENSDDNERVRCLLRLSRLFSTPPRETHSKRLPSILVQYDLRKLPRRCLYIILREYKIVRNESSTISAFQKHILSVHVSTYDEAPHPFSFTCMAVLTHEEVSGEKG